MRYKEVRLVPTDIVMIAIAGGTPLRVNEFLDGEIVPDDSISGMCVGIAHKKRTKILVWVKRHARNLVVHECFHAIGHLQGLAGVDDSSEWNALMMEFMVEEIMDKRGWAKCGKVGGEKS